MELEFLEMASDLAGKGLMVTGVGETPFSLPF